MLGKINEVFQNHHIVCVVLKNEIDSYLIGCIEHYDQEGIILYNIDYRGTATCHVYISIEEIENIEDRPCYIDKIKILFNASESKKKYLKFPHKYNLKRDFLEWIYCNHKLIKLTFEDEQFEGYINKNEDHFINVSKICSYTGADEGHTIIRIEYLAYFNIKI